MCATLPGSRADTAGTGVPQITQPGFFFIIISGVPPPLSSSSEQGVELNTSWAFLASAIWNLPTFDRSQKDINQTGWRDDTRVQCCPARLTFLGDAEKPEEVTCQGCSADCAEREGLELGFGKLVWRCLFKSRKRGSLPGGSRTPLTSERAPWPGCCPSRGPVLVTLLRKCP